MQSADCGVEEERDPFCPFQPQHMIALESGECSERCCNLHGSGESQQCKRRPQRLPLLRKRVDALRFISKGQDFPDNLFLISPCIFGTRSVTKVGTLPHYLEQDEGLIKTRKDKDSCKTPLANSEFSQDGCKRFSARMPPISVLTIV